FVGYNKIGQDIGGGLWKTEPSASVVDKFGNPVRDSTAVFFTIATQDYNPIIRKILGSPNLPPIACEVIYVQNSVSGANVNIVGSSVTFNEGPISGNQERGVAFTSLTYRGVETNGKLWIVASAATSNGVVVKDSLLVDLALNEPELSCSSGQPSVIRAATGCWTWIPVTGTLSDGQANGINGSPIGFGSTRGVFTLYYDLDGWHNNCLYESGNSNSCSYTTYELLNPGKPTPVWPADFSQPLQAAAITNSSGSATDTLVFDCNDVDDPQQTDPPFPIISTENVTITVSVIGSGVTCQPPSVTLSKQHYTPPADPQSPAELECRVGTCVTWCNNVIVDPVSLQQVDLKRKMVDYRSREVFQIPDANCLGWYTPACSNSPEADMAELRAQINAK
ncbi:hypothetical protein IT568_09730, partial [bacterium]|nr:hypothetical protein [bacterium]